MRGVIAAGAYVPHGRLDRAEIGAFFGKGGGRGTRAVASFDEDTTSMGVEAARLALRSAPGVAVDDLWFATAAPAYLEKTNACAVHAALRLDPAAGALDVGGATRSGAGALRTALRSGGTTLVVTSDLRTGLPTSGDEAKGGDGAAAVLVGDDSAGPVVAELLGVGVATEEFTDRWRLPGATRGRAWEERFAEGVYGDLVAGAVAAALAEAGLESVDHLAVHGHHERSVAQAERRLRPQAKAVVDGQLATVGNTGTAHAALLLCAALDVAQPGETIALVTLADGVEVLVLRATPALAEHRPARSVADQVAAGGRVPYGRYLSWRGMVTVEPPNRPSPPRTSASAAHRANDWKFGFVGSRDRSSGMIHLPPARVSEKGGAVDDMEPVPMADTVGTVVSFTVDRLVYSPSPPVVFAVVDFDGGGRVPLEVTDAEPDDVVVGARVEPTFRRLFTEDEIHNYFWKVRPVRAGEA